MSTGKRLAKRSIIGTRVSAPGGDGMYYSGVINGEINGEKSSKRNSKKYTVTFDMDGGTPPSNTTPFSCDDLIGNGFQSMTSTSLNAGQKVYLTYNGREIQAEVIEHRKQIDEVDVLIAPNGQESKMTLTKRIEEIRLTQSRKSARLAYTDTDFARLADMAGDRKRAASHSIDVPHVPGSRKRRPSSGNDSDKSETMRVPRGCGREGCRTNARGDCMDECTAALVLMSLSCSPVDNHMNDPLRQRHCQHNYGSWEAQAAVNGVAGSPGANGVLNSSSDSSSCGASYRTGTPSPPLSDTGAPIGSIWTAPIHHPSHNPLPCSYSATVSPVETTPNSSGNFDEGIVSDYLDDFRPRKKKKSRARVNRDLVENGTNEGYHFENFELKRSGTIFECTWPKPKCHEVRATADLIKEHVRKVHLGPKPKIEPKKEPVDGDDVTVDDGTVDDASILCDEDFHYREIEVKFVSSPPTMSHRDMARPPHEDPEYQKQLRLQCTPIAVIHNINNNNINNQSNHHSVHVKPLTGSVIRENTNTVLTFGISPSASLQQNPSLKHMKSSARQFSVSQPHNVGLLTVTTDRLPQSPRRTRGDTKKCRKIYGMEQRNVWCTQCKWKKACTRFNEPAS